MKKGKRKQVAGNKKARHDYFIEDTYETGIVLTGTEIKSIKMGKCSIKESFAKIVDGEVYILGMHVTPYEQGNIFNVDPLRQRKLLLHRREINKLMNYTKQDGMTIVPLQIYIDERGRAKLELAVAKGKKLYDKRESIAQRDAKRRMDKEIRREMR